MFFEPSWYLVIPDDTWQYQQYLTKVCYILQIYWTKLIISDTWQYLHNTSRYLAYTWQYFVIPYGIILNKIVRFSLQSTGTIPGNTWQYFTVLNNTYQFLTIPDKPGIGWYRQSFKYCCQYNSSIVKVLSWYGSDGFLSVLSSQYQFWQFSQNLWCLMLSDTNYNCYAECRGAIVRLSPLVWQILSISSSSVMCPKER